MSDKEERRNLYAGTLGHDSAAVRRRIAEIRKWGERNDRPFVEDLLNANPRLEWGIPEVGRDPIPEDFELAFGLTRVEAEIAAAFASGHKLTAIAAARGCSINTVRTHFTHIKDKLGKTKQTDVLRELMKIV